MKVMVLLWPRCLTRPLVNAVCLYITVCISLVHAQQAKWPGCMLPATTAAAATEGPSQLEIPARALGCSFILQASGGAARLGAAGRVVQLAGEARISGLYNDEIRRPPAVQLAAAAEDGGATAQQHTVLLLPADGTLVLQDLLLADITLADLAQHPDQVLRPTTQHIPAGTTLHMTDVRILVSPDQLQQYIVSVSGSPGTVSWTDNTTFLHIRSFSSAAANGSAGLEARHVTLLAQGAATEASRSPSGLGSNSSTAVATAAVDSSSRSGTNADAAGILTVTDSYILSANNATLVTLLQQLAGLQQSNRPLLIFITSNMTFAHGDPRWPAGGVNITRPTIWIGSSSSNTSLDFHMDVGQFVLDGPTANVTLVNLALENLAYGDEVSARDAEGKSLIRSHLIWAFRYRRSEPRLVLWDCVMVLPEQLQIDSFVYWADAFNSDLDFWKNQTAFMRDALGITEETYTRGHLPGNYIVQIYKKDQRMTNVTYTARPYVAPALPLPMNPSLHSDLVTYRADPAVGPVYSREDVAVTLWNMRRNGCGQRGLILLPTPATNNTVYWGSATLNFNHQQEGSTSTAADSPGSSSSTAVEVQPLRASEVPDLRLLATKSTTAAAVSSSLPNVWPSAGGELVECPVQFRGVSRTDEPNTEIDLGFVRGLFRLDGSGQSGSADKADSSPGSQAGAPQVPGYSSAAAAAAAGGGGGPRGPILQFSQLILKSMPQGEGYGGDAAAAAAAEGSGSPGYGTAQAGTAAPASSASWSSIPAEAFTHLLWFVTRDVTKDDMVSVTNITLVVPPAEAVQLQSAAAAAMAAAGGSSETAVLSVVYPSASGPLPVVYRSLSITQNPAVVAAAYANFFVGRRRASRRLLLSPPAAAATGSGTMLCLGNMKGSGITARNLCLLAQDASYPLPPGYRWGSVDGSSSNQPWPGWKVALLVVFTVVPCLLLLWLASRWHSRRKQQQQQQQQRQKSTSQKAILPVLLSPSGSSDGAVAAADGGGIHSSKDVLTPATVVAAVIPAVAAATVGSEATASSDTLKAYAVAGVEDCYGSSTTNTGSEAECICSKGCVAAADYAAAAAAAAACANIEGAEKAACAVGMGEQLGRLAALHRGMLGHEDENGPHPVCRATRGTLLPSGGEQQLQQLLYARSPLAPQLEDSRSSQQQQQQMFPQGSFEQQPQLSGQWSFEHQDQQMRRLSQAITQVSLEVHMRRLGQTPCGSTASGANSAAGSQHGSSTDNAQPPPGAIVYSAPRAPRRGNHPRGPRRFASAVTVPRDEMRRRVKRMSIDEMKVFVAEQPDWAELEQLYKEGLLRSGVSVTPPRSSSRTRTPTPSSSSSSLSLLQQQAPQQLQLHEVIGTGTFGVVYRATWRGIQAAVKVMQLPADADLAAGAPGAGLPLRNIGCGGVAGSRQEQMAVMETALGSSLSHPNIVQVYTYLLRPLGYSRGRCSLDGSTMATAPYDGLSSENSLADELAANSMTRHSPKLGRMSGSSSSSAVSGFELQLVMEYCPLGSLRGAIDGCLLEDRFTGRPQYLTVLSLALGVARAMHHMHSEGVLHGDLKAGNVLLKNEVVAPTVSSFGGWPSSPNEAAPASDVLVSKVADFGLACRISDQDTHISGVHRGTPSHMSPELLVHGRASRASDVYAMGILLWEMATGDKAFAGVAKPMLGALVVRDRARPQWPSSSGHWNPLALTAAALSGDEGGALSVATDVHPPIGYRQLTEACWAQEAQDRPTFGEIVATLETLLAQEQQQQAAWEAFAQQQQQQQLVPAGAAAPLEGPHKQRTVTFSDPPVSGSIRTGGSSMLVADDDCSSAPDSHKSCQAGDNSSRVPKYTRASATAAVAAVLGLEGHKYMPQKVGHMCPAATTDTGIEMTQHLARPAPNSSSSSIGQPMRAQCSSSKVQSARVGTDAATRGDGDMQGLRDALCVQQQQTHHAVLPASVRGPCALEGRVGCGGQLLQAVMPADTVSAAAQSQPVGAAATGRSRRFSAAAVSRFGAAAQSPFGAMAAGPFEAPAAAATCASSRSNAAAASPFCSVAQSPFGAVAAGSFAAPAAAAEPGPCNAAAHSLSDAAAAANRFSSAAASPFGPAAQSPFAAVASPFSALTADQSAAPALLADSHNAAVHDMQAAIASAGQSSTAAAAQHSFGAAHADPPWPAAAAPVASFFAAAAQSLSGAAYAVPSVPAAAAATPFGAAAWSPFDQLKDQSWG